MKNKSQAIVLILFFAAALIYTIWNYLNGGTDLFVLATAIVITGFPLVQLVLGLIRGGGK